MTVYSPVGPGLTQGRTDQGVDYSGAGPVDAVGAGTILNLYNPGWPGGAFIAEELASPPDPLHAIVYYAEDIAPSVAVGQSVSGGEALGQATGGADGIEVGWGSSSLGQSLQADSGPYAGSGATPQGQSFLSYISGGALGSSTTPATATGITSSIGSALAGPFAGATADFTNWATKAMFVVLGLSLAALGVWKLANPGKSASSSVTQAAKSAGGDLKTGGSDDDPAMAAV